MATDKYPQTDSLRETFGQTLVDLADTGYDFYVIDCDVAGGTGAHRFRAAYPDRFVQCGIAEQNGVGVAAGLSAATDTPVFICLFEQFALRALEIFRLSVAYARRDVKLVLSHPSITCGPDGASIHSVEGLACWRAIPGIQIVVPCDPLELRQAVPAVLDNPGPAVLYTGRNPAHKLLAGGYRFQLGRGQVIRDGADVTLVACGEMLYQALVAADMLKVRGITARVVLMSTVKPLDEALLVRCAQETGAIVTVEMHSVMGGLGAAVAEALGRLAPCPLETVGMPDCFGRSGEPDDLLAHFGLTGQHVAAAVRRAMERKKK